MAYIVNCLLACALVLTSTMCVSSFDPAPQFGIELQCQTRGPYAGACKSQNKFGDELTCLRLACAFHMANGYYRAVYTHRVDDGTVCGRNKVCESGVCVTKDPSLITLPISNVPQFNCISSPVPSICPYPRRTHRPRTHQPSTINPSTSSSTASGSRSEATASGSRSEATASTSRGGRGSHTHQRRQ